MKRICLISYFTTIFNILKAIKPWIFFSKRFFLTFFSVKSENTTLSVFTKSQQKTPSLSIFFSSWLYGKYFFASNQTFWGNFDYFMSKLTTFNQSAVLCLCWPLSALIFLSTNTQLLRATDFAGALSFTSGAARAFSHFSFKNCKHSI